MPAIGPQYLPIRVMADWRCLTMTSGFIWAAAIPAIPPSVTARAAATRVFLIGPTSSSCGNRPHRMKTLQPAWYSLPQPGGVLRDGSDLALGHAGSHPAHHPIGIVGSPTLLERLELR